MSGAIPDAAKAKNVEAIRHSSGADAEAIAARLEGTTVHVHVEPAGDPAGNRQREIHAYVLLNLLPRMFERVSCSGVNPRAIFPSSPMHANRINAVEGIDFGADVVVTGSNSPLETGDGGSDVLYVDNRGWTSYLSTEGPWTVDHGPFNPVGAYYAAALAVGDVFNRVFADLYERAQPVEGTHRFDMVSLEETDVPRYEPRVDGQDVHLEDLMLVGVGAIGQVFVDALSLLPRLSGFVQLVDHENTDEGNQARYVLAYPENTPTVKVHLAEQRLRASHPLLRIRSNVPLLSRVSIQQQFYQLDHGRGLNRGALRFEPRMLIPMPGTDYEMYRDITDDTRPRRLVVCAVDSEHARRDIQAGLHREILNGWTEADDGRLDLAVGRHRIGDDNACLACIYQPDLAEDEPGLVEFISRLTGWDEKTVEARLQEDSDYRANEEDLQKVARARGIPPEKIQELVGKSLAEVVHDPQCGLAHLSGNDRDSTAPVPHLPALAGCLLATQVVLDALGVESGLESIAQFDALLPPNEFAREASRSPEAGCICGMEDVRAAYDDLWDKE